MALTLDRIVEIGKEQFGNLFHLRPTDAQFARAIEAAATAPLLAHIAALTAQVEQASVLEQQDADVREIDQRDFEAFANARYLPSGYKPIRRHLGYADDAWQLAWEAFRAARVTPRKNHSEQHLWMVEQAAQPVTHQFQARDGTWHGFIDESHMENTIKDGSWPIRALYTAPPKAVPLTEAQREVLAYLDGTGPLDGIWYGDKHPTEQGAFWWRKRLWAAFGTPATVEKEGE